MAERKPIAERFWSKVNRRGPDECWPWLGAGTSGGYGCIGYHGRLARAHRLSWILANGPIPHGPGYHGTCVLHRCDNPPCVNPAHLFLGTQGDNRRDQISKGRSPDWSGERNGHAKLTTTDVLMIRFSPETTRGLARRLNVTPMAIRLIRQRKVWKHLP